MFSDIPNCALPPTVSPSNDGVTARYAGRGTGLLSLQVTIPYTARKGRHQFGFPAYDALGQLHTNNTFAIVVYDETPHITSVSPTSVVAATPTPLTIIGYGFGDRPTIYEANTACTSTGSACSFNGVVTHNGANDSVTITVTLQGSSAVPVYVVSNGAGPDPFFGPPTSSAQPGPPQSNTVQVPIQPPSPAITQMTELSTVQSQAFDSTVQFTMTGTHFGTAGLPALSFQASSGITVYQIDPNTATDTFISGTFILPANTAAATYSVALTPYGSSLFGTAWFNVAAGPPTISGSSGIWWFGGVTPGCDTAKPFACYYTSDLLTAAPGAGGSSPSPTAPAVWQVVANGGNVSWTCKDQDPSCASIVVTAQGATSPVCTDPANETQFTVTLAGVSSPPFYVTIDMPAGLEVYTDQYSGKAFIVDTPYTINNTIGYQTGVRYLIRSACGYVMLPVYVNEFFGQGTRSPVLFNGVVNDWPFAPNNASSWFKGSWDVTDFYADTNTFNDYLTQAGSPNTFHPPPQSPPADPSALGGYLGTSTVWLLWQPQTFRVGSLTQGLGYTVKLGYVTFYLDHGRSLTSPPQ